MNECQCDQDFACNNHDVVAEQDYWAAVLGIRPRPSEVAFAYEPGDYKGRFWADWNVA